MIIQSLHGLYERLSADAESASHVAPKGYSVQNVSFVIELDPDGSLVQIQDWTSDGKARRVIVPGETKPTGSGLNPCFLWDNPGYLFGIAIDDKKVDEKKIARNVKSFREFRSGHMKVKAEIDNPAFDGVCAFLDFWRPEPEFIAGQPDHIVTALRSIVPGNGVFRIRGQLEFVHDIQGIKSWWQSRSNPKKWWETGESKVVSDQFLGQCAVTGFRKVPIARLHEPKIKGVAGTNMSGASLVSFNEAAYNSYGLEQSRNASISEQAAFAYCNALNQLLARGSRQKLGVGGSTYVFWTDRPAHLTEESVYEIFGGYQPSSESDSASDDDEVSSVDQSSSNSDSSPAQSEMIVMDIRDALRKLRSGKRVPEMGDSETRFFVLGLSPNAGRIAVRYWSESSLGDFLGHLARHLQDIEIVGARANQEFPTIRTLVAQSAREPRDAPDLLAGALMRSVIEGLPYPIGLYGAYIRRIRADRSIDSIRAGFLKATLNRQFRFGFSNLSQELPMSLDPGRPEPAYQMGRLFAALERNQSDALGRDVNATINDRYFGAASSTPASVFPRLIRLTQHHLSALEGGKRVNADKRMQEIMSHLAVFPPHLSLADQGLFAIGYYHQVQDFFTRKEPAAADDSGTETNP